MSGRDAFLAAVATHARRQRGVLTYCNHISVMDEPTMWGVLPWWTFRDARTVRWTLTASDIMFTSRAAAWLAHQGQAIETVRGGGIFQPALPHAADMLARGDWIHMFPEGGINPAPPAHMRRFKWGISRLVLEPDPLPLVVPIYISGFEHAMPPDRTWPRVLPRAGADIRIAFGDALPDHMLEAYRAAAAGGPLPPRPAAPAGHIYPEAPTRLAPGDSLHMATVRSHLAAYLRAELVRVGERAM